MLARWDSRGVTSPLVGARRLVLLRHAKAENGGDLTDQLRPLALSGRRQAAQVGATLDAAGLVPDLILCSSAVRTRQTWDLARAAFGSPAGELEIVDALYHGGVRGLLDAVRAVAADLRTVLVVGHEPAMSHATALLAGAGSDEATVARVRVGMPTGSYAVLDLDVAWAQLEPRSARVVRVVAPA